MISYEELKQISEMRLRDAQILLANNSYDGALYLCGYAVEIALKSLICKSLSVSDVKSVAHIPNTTEEFDIISKMKTHKLEDLLKLTAFSSEVKREKLADWSTVLKWNPEMRYSPVHEDEKETREIIEAARRLLCYFWEKIDNF